MGNKVSSSSVNGDGGSIPDGDAYDKDRFRSFPGATMLEKTFCGSIDTTDPAEYANVSTMNRLLKRAEVLCVSSPVSSDGRNGFADDDTDDDDDDETNNSMLQRSTKTKGSSSAMGQPLYPLMKQSSTAGRMLARALVSEVTDNPKTMKHGDMQDRERRLLKAGAAAAAHGSSNNASSSSHHGGGAGAAAAGASGGSSKPVGVAAPPNVLRSVAFACTGDDDAVGDLCSAQDHELYNFNDEMSAHNADHPHTVTIGVSLSRRSKEGNPLTITRQSAYDWNLLQDRTYKYVSATTGWRAGGGDGSMVDTLHLPIIHIVCPDEAAIGAVIAALASGEIFIPHLSVLPEQLTVYNTRAGGTDLVVHFGCERNGRDDHDGDDAAVEEWPNWGLEFMHNQLYDYFHGHGAVWMKRPFSVTLAKQVRWKTVKHMNRYFAQSEKVVAGWRGNGPQPLEATAPHLEGGASADEVARPHGIYLFQGGVPTNYFAPNFDPPYATKMTRSLLRTVLQKSWDKKRREWTSKPVPRVVEPSALLLAAACGYDPVGTGFMAREVTTVSNPPGQSTSVVVAAPRTPVPVVAPVQQQLEEPKPLEPLSEVEFGHSGSEDASQKENVAGPQRSSSVAATLPPARYADAQPQQSRSTSNSYRTIGGGLSARQSVPLDDANQSVAESGTTVPHTNLTATARHPGPASLAVGKKKSYSKSPVASLNKNNHSTHSRLYSDEDFMNELDDDAAAADATPESRPLSSVQQESPVHRDSSPTKRAQFKNDRAKAAHYIPHGGSAAATSPRGSGTTVEAAASLEYSTDGSSAFCAPDAVSLYGQQYSSPKSQTQTRKSAALLSQQQQQQQSMAPVSYRKSGDDDDESTTMLSLQASSSSVQSVVPSDEELFSVGWAKALDSSSGNYYYFTLDRSKTIWENPLSASQWGGELPPPVAKPPERQQSIALDP